MLAVSKVVSNELFRTKKGPILQKEQKSQKLAQKRII